MCGFWVTTSGSASVMVVPLLGGEHMSRQLFKLGTGVLTVCALIGTAGAADLRVPVKAPALVPLFNWTSCYIGGYVGGAWNERDATFTDLGNSNFRAFS